MTGKNACPTDQDMNACPTDQDMNACPTDQDMNACPTDQDMNACPTRINAPSPQPSPGVPGEGVKLHRPLPFPLPALTGRRTLTAGRLWLLPLRLALVLTFVPPRVGRRLSEASPRDSVDPG